MSALRHSSFKSRSSSVSLAVVVGVIAAVFFERGWRVQDVDLFKSLPPLGAFVREQFGPGGSHFAAILPWAILKSSELNSAVSPVHGQIITAEMIKDMGNNTLFTRWRPYSHFQSPAGWLNDPCGALYDPATNLYHMHYQFHPLHVTWGNISWGHATSPDLVSWTDVDHSPGGDYAAWQGVKAISIEAGKDTSNHHTPALYNHLGIWSGTAQPINLTGEADGTLLAFYTSLSQLPTAWDLPYLIGTESQSFALSTNGGITWQQYAGNPVLGTPPGNWNITGWRDPYFQTSPALDGLLEYAEPHYYLVFGSGIKGVGPRMPLYSAPATNLTDWTFLGALWEPLGNSTLGNLDETGSYGFNFEMSNFFELDGHWFVSMSVQGGNTTLHNHDWVLWHEGTISARTNGSVAFDPISGGAADWGNLYAITSFHDTKHNRRVQIGWSPEDMNGFGITQQGWQGAFSLLREIFVKNTTGVVHSASETIPGNSYYTSTEDGVWTARTLGVRPLQDVVKALRKSAKYTHYNIGGLPTSPQSMILAKKLSRSYEIRAVIESTTGTAGVTVAASPNGEEYTTVWYDPARHAIGVDRGHSSLIQQFSNTTYERHFEPYTFAANGTPEAVILDVFVDGSMLEVYVNDRFALTSRIYPSMEASSGVGVFVGRGAEVVFGSVEVWDGLGNVWPGRPLNSSAGLVWDSPGETGGYTWWEGN